MSVGVGWKDILYVYRGLVADFRTEA
jgi:hypothetical protein